MIWPIGLLIIIITVLTQTLGQYAGECLLSNEETGRCLPVVSCKPLYELLQNVSAGKAVISAADSERLQRLYCGKFDDVVHVCCSESDTQLNPEGIEILKNQTCGSYKTRRISNGAEAALSAFPWMALLVYNDTRNRFKCGGSLISEQYVLTAAHCIMDDLYQVRLGEHRISTNPDCIRNNRHCALPVQNIDIEKYFVHRDYKSGRIFHDIALIRLDRKAQLQNNIKPICLPIYDELRAKTPEMTIMSGWGKTHNARSSDILMAVAIPLVERTECQKILALRRSLTYATVCAGNVNNADGCTGDSGGPLAYKADYNGMPRIIQLGVLSIGADSCGGVNAPSIYTNVSHYLQWVTDKIKN